MTSSNCDIMTTQEKKTTPVIALFTIGRSLSTAVQKSVSQLEGGLILFEPYFAEISRCNEWLEILLSAENTKLEDEMFRRVSNSLNEAERQKYKFVLIKECASTMASHFEALLQPFWSDSKAIFLIRHPYKVMASAYKTLEGDKQRGMAIFQSRILRELYHFIELHFNYEPAIFDADDLERNPPATMKAICEAAGLEYDERMLSWKKEQLDVRIFARYHHTLENSAGFIRKDPSQIAEKRQATSIKSYPDWLINMMEEDLPNYLELYHRRVIVP